MESWFIRSSVAGGVIFALDVQYLATMENEMIVQSGRQCDEDVLRRQHSGELIEHGGKRKPAPPTPSGKDNECDPASWHCS